MSALRLRLARGDPTLPRAAGFAGAVASRPVGSLTGQRFSRTRQTSDCSPCAFMETAFLTAVRHDSLTILFTVLRWTAEGTRRLATLIRTFERMVPRALSGDCSSG